MEFIPGFLDESGPFIDDINVSEVELLARSENLILELGNLGKIEPFEVIDKGEVTEILEKVRGLRVPGRQEKLGDNVFNGEREEIMVERGNQWQEK